VTDIDAAAFRAQFPVLDRLAYLNAGTDGPLARVAVDAAAAELDSAAVEGRIHSHFERRRTLAADLRAAYADVLGCDVAEVAVTTSTSEGIGTVLGGLGLGPGDEIVTSDSEHPGLLGPLIIARERGVTIKAVPLRDVADAVSATTTLVACSHVNWLTGELAPAALRDVPVPVVLDGAQGVGAIAVDVRALGCAAYAGSGQKWLCGADGTGMLYLEPEFGERVSPTRPGYTAFQDATRGLESTFSPEARKLDAISLPREGLALSLAALELLTATGLDGIFARAASLAAELARQLADAGYAVAPRADTTLVAWEDPDPEATRERLAGEGIAIRNLPGTPLLRASVGAWNDESDLERLLSALGAAAG
jgi:selenocysteine lyase/cysteine desulfurase